ncbi:monovalent cation/H(+) antiporter subunit G [Haloferax sp. DFSO52]|uniref:monovalent cation/H(+) antiporter subunit G n=1 Tax=Haloferax sp. DFSO52 TaxID=3388505 RepID=UPI003A854717
MTAESAAAVTVGPVRAALVILLTLVGNFFLVVGTIGLLRFPNVYNRMHATSKATTLGAASIALAGTVYYLPAGDGLMSLVTVVFLFLTAPTGAHMISQAAQRMGVPFLNGVQWPGEQNDLMREGDAGGDD